MHTGNVKTWTAEDVTLMQIKKRSQIKSSQGDLNKLDLYSQIIKKPFPTYSARWYYSHLSLFDMLWKITGLIKTLIIIDFCIALTAPVLLSTLQSGIIFESVTIQLLILSLLLLSTAKKERNTFFKQLENTKRLIFCPFQTENCQALQNQDITVSNTHDTNDHLPSLCCALRLSSLGARGPSTFL